MSLTAPHQRYRRRSDIQSHRTSEFNVNEIQRSVEGPSEVPERLSSYTCVRSLGLEWFETSRSMYWSDSSSSLPSLLTRPFRSGQTVLYIHTWTSERLHSLLKTKTSLRQTMRPPNTIVFAGGLLTFWWKCLMLRRGWLHFRFCLGGLLLKW